ARHGPVLPSRHGPAACSRVPRGPPTPTFRSLHTHARLSGPPRGVAMPGYETLQKQVTIGGHDYRLRVLADRQQFWDPDGHGERLGISSAQWALFGQLWPAGRLLAGAMQEFDIGGKRILELGCGIGLASLVL